MDRDTLQRIEWTSDRISVGGSQETDDWCPCCHALRRRGHDAGCALAAALAPVGQTKETK